MGLVAVLQPCYNSIGFQQSFGDTFLIFFPLVGQHQERERDTLCNGLLDFMLIPNTIFQPPFEEMIQMFTNISIIQILKISLWNLSCFTPISKKKRTRYKEQTWIHKIILYLTYIMNEKDLPLSLLGLQRGFFLWQAQVIETCSIADVLAMFKQTSYWY